MLARVSRVVKVFDATTTSVVAGSSGFTASSNAAPSMFERKRTSSLDDTPAERIDQQRRPKHRSADADMQHAGDVAERAGFDRIDQSAHALPASGREVDVSGAPLPRSATCVAGAALARIDDLAGKQSVARARRSPSARRAR